MKGSWVLGDAACLLRMLLVAEHPEGICSTSTLDVLDCHRFPALANLRVLRLFLVSSRVETQALCGPSTLLSRATGGRPWLPHARPETLRLPRVEQLAV